MQSAPYVDYVANAIATTSLELRNLAQFAFALALGSLCCPPMVCPQGCSSKIFLLFQEKSGTSYYTLSLFRAATRFRLKADP